HVRAPEVPGSSVEVGLDTDLLDAAPEPRERRAGIAADVVAPSDQHGLHARAFRPKSSRDDEAVAAIVPLAAENRDALAADGGKHTRDRIRGAGAGLLHQPDPGDPERRDGAGVERPHLGRREDGQHGYVSWEAEGAAARVDALRPWTTRGLRRDTTLSGQWRVIRRGADQHRLGHGVVPIVREREQHPIAALRVRDRAAAPAQHHRRRLTPLPPYLE